MDQKARSCGYVAIIGLPNAGKSTLVNQLVGKKVSIVTHKPQTTRFRILGIRVVDEAQVILMDTPGVFTGNTRLEKAMVGAVWQAARDSDVDLLLIDAERGISPRVKELIDDFKRHTSKGFIGVLNKVDKVNKDSLLEMAHILTREGAQEVFMISALKGSGCADLMTFLASKMPQGPWLFDEDQLSDINERLWASEITREVLLLRVHQEVPYALSVETETWEVQKDGTIKVQQQIIVEKESHRAIILGHKGETIKTIGQLARAQMSTLLDTTVHLFLHVKVDEKWSERRSYYEDRGL